jgi:hypothetical protein
LNGTFLYDANGNKIKAQGLDGKDGKDGKNGEDGKDGINGINGNKFEFIYKLVADESVVVNKPSRSQADNYVPTSEGWTKTPSGISSISRVEYFCQREKISDI